MVKAKSGKPYVKKSEAAASKVAKAKKVRTDRKAR